MTTPDPSGAPRRHSATRPPAPGPSPAAAWDSLRDALHAAARSLAAPGGVDTWLDEARFLVLDDRATLPDLTALATRGSFGAWPTLRDCPMGTAALVLAVLEGWEREGVAGTGRTASPATAFENDRWDGEPPSAPVEVAAVWCAAAAHRLGLQPRHARAWARAGLLRHDDAPDPGWALDPHDGPDADPAPSPEDDDIYQQLLLWRDSAGRYDAPVCRLAGLDPARAAVTLALPPDHPERALLLTYVETLYE